MSSRLDLTLEGGLEQLRVDGRRHLTAAARRDAWDAAWRRAAPLAVATAVVALALALLRAIPAAAAIALAVAAWLAALAFDYARRRRGASIGRQAALGLVDDQLRLKDRLTTSDEFLRRPDRDGFHEAALAEAAPWIERALGTPLAPVPARPRGGRWPWLAGAAAILAATLLVRHADRWPSDAAPRAAASASHIAEADAAAARDPDLAGPSERERAIEARNPASAGTPDGTALPRSAANAVAPMGSAAAGAQGRAGRDGATAGRSSEPARAAAAAAGRAGGGDAKREAGPKSGAGFSARGGTDVPSGDPRAGRPGANGGTKADQEKGGDRQAARQDRERMPAGFPMPSAARPSASPPSQAGQGNKPPQPGTASRQGGGQKGGKGQQGQQGQSSGQGQGAGRGAGQDAVKRTRGSSSLLLAVPMEDRLIGMPSPGRVNSVTRAAPPRPSAAGQVAAQDRGRQNGDSGELLHRADTAHDARVLRDFFRLRRGEPPAAGAEASR